MRPALPFVVLVACVPAPRIAPVGEASPIELVESWPLETTLDHADIRDAKEVWRELIDSAKHSIDFAEFYASPAGKGATSDVLEPLVEAIEAAAARGVKVRWLGENIFYEKYPEILDRLAAHDGIQVRRFDVKHLMGGILHAKYFVVDGRTLYLGSQNFDWRSLEHIQELGVVVRLASPVRALTDIFETDWALAAGAPKQQRAAPPAGGYAFPTALDSAAPGRGTVSLVASPKGFLPDETLWELPAIVRLIDSAKLSVRAQLLLYGTESRDGDFLDLQEAMQRAAARGVEVELLVSDWSTRSATLQSLKRLHAPPSLTVKVITIPPWSKGAVPFGRVAHAKYLVVDGQHAWIGTSNWERSYFFQSRNVGVILDDGPLPAALDAFFSDNWRSRYVELFDPEREYPKK